MQNGTVSIYGYVNDAIGRRTSMSRSGSAYATPATIFYIYNNRSELTGASSNVDTTYSYSYAYDPIGNRITASEAGVPWTYATNNLNQYTSAIENNDHLSFSYDLDGSMTYRPVDATSGWTQIWNGENRMVETCKGTDRLTFKYDYQGRRVEKCVYSDNTLTSRTLFVYDGFKCVEELDAMNNNAVSILHAWQPLDVGLDVILATTDGGGTSFFLFDAQKDAMQKTHTNPNLMISSNYKPTGGNIGLNGEYIGFSSEFYDYVLELVYYNYRYYIPDFGRWIKRDPSEIHDYLNLYRFVNNDYINFYDNLGLHGVPGSGLSPSLPSNPSQEFTSAHNRITQLQIQYARYMQCQKENEERKKKNLCPIRCPQFPNTPSELDCNCVCQELYQGVHSALIAPCTENCQNFKPLIGLVPKKKWWKFW